MEDLGTLAVAEASSDAAPSVDSTAAQRCAEAAGFMAVAERTEAVADIGKFLR
jgi:hypothetical protein